jgi:hypothetical protein
MMQPENVKNLLVQMDLHSMPALNNVKEQQQPQQHAQMAVPLRIQHVR